MSNIPRWVIDGLPPLNARTVLSRKQCLWGSLLLLALGYAFYRDAWATFMWLNTAVIMLYLVFAHYKLIVQFLCPGAPPPGVPSGDMSPIDWPRYSVMVPLYREARVAAGLVAHLKAMDYPADRLQVLLLVEEDDDPTRSALESCGLAPPFEVIVVPVSLPRTKPKACNYGLRRANGELLVIYDAEDRPDTDQLKKAARLFTRVPENVICLQAMLDFYNPARNIITRLFTTEYSYWFYFFLPGLHLLDAPIPLGGTSNHFRLQALKQLGGWDPFNVTEDCDLGIRLYIEGYRTVPLDSVTWEEATFRIAPWVRQRSRWFKGYLQTYLVHMRSQLPLLSKGGPRALLHFHMIFGANCFCLVLNPLYWTLTILWFATREEVLSSFYPLWILLPALLAFLAGNAAFILSPMLACIQRRRYELIPYCLLTPFYWALMSLAAWKGLLQLVTRPFYWEKTPHQGTVRLLGDREEERVSRGLD